MQVRTHRQSGLRPAVVVAGDVDQIDAATVLAERWRARVEAAPAVPIVDPDEPRIVLGAASARGDRALDSKVICGMGYGVSELTAATAAAVRQAARLEAELGPSVASRLDGAVVGVVPGDDRFVRVVACLDARRRGAGRVLLVGRDARAARAAGADAAVPPPH
jgi:hypothetical protein